MASTPTNPEHYSRWKIQLWDFISQNNLDFMRGNIIKYIMRFDAKNGLEDLKKARVYLDKMIKNTIEEIGEHTDNPTNELNGEENEHHNRQ